MEADSRHAPKPDFLEFLHKFTMQIVDFSGGNARIAHNEANDSSEAEPEAAHFLKVNGKRVGRDLELYNFMAVIAKDSTPPLTDYLGEVVLTANVAIPGLLSHVSDTLKNEAVQFVAPEHRSGWVGLIESLTTT